MSVATRWARMQLLARPRRPEALPKRLDRHRIYVLPTRFGLFVATLLVAMLLVAATALLLILLVLLALLLLVRVLVLLCHVRSPKPHAECGGRGHRLQRMVNHAWVGGYICVYACE